MSQGSIIYANATPKWAELVVGGAGTILHTDGTDVAWATLATAGIEAAGTAATAVAAHLSAYDHAHYDTAYGWGNHAGLYDLVGAAATVQGDVDGFPDALKNLTAGEVGQLENIGAVTISATQWGYLGALDQGLTTGSAVQFASLGLTAALIAGSTLSLGAAVASSVAAPLTLNLGGTYANAAGDQTKAKFILYDDEGGDITGFGISQSIFEIYNKVGTMNYYHAGVLKAALAHTGTSTSLTLIGENTGPAYIQLLADAGQDNGDGWRLRAEDGGEFVIQNDSTGSFVDLVHYTSSTVQFDANVGIGKAPSYALDITSTSDDVFRAASTRNIATASMFRLYHNRGTGNVADNDKVEFKIYSDSDTTASALTSTIYHKAEDVTHAVRDAGLGFQTMLNGVLGDALYLAGDKSAQFAGTAQTTKLTASDSVQVVEKIRLSGQEFYAGGNTDTEGIALLLHVNRTTNRQFSIADTARLTQNTTYPTFRVVISSAVAIGAIATDGSTRLPLTIDGSTLSLKTGGSAAITLDASQDATFAGGVGIGVTPAVTLLDMQLDSDTVFNPTNDTYQGIWIYNKGDGTAHGAFANLSFRVTQNAGTKNAIGSINYVQIVDSEHGGAFAFRLKNDAGNHVLALRVGSDLGITMPGLAGSGSRTVVADANGLLSAP